MSFFEKVLHTNIRQEPSCNCSLHYKAIELNDVPIVDGGDNMSENLRTSGDKFKCNANECDLERKVCSELNELTSTDPNHFFYAKTTFCAFENFIAKVLGDITDRTVRCSGKVFR